MVSPGFLLILKKVINQIILNKKMNNDKIILLLKNIIKKLKNNNCNIKKLSKETNGFTEINGNKLPGELLPTQDNVTMLNVINAQGQRVFINKGIRKAGTRVGIHVHKFGGYTLVLSGEITDFVQGKKIMKMKAPGGYYMPPCTPMSAANLGTEDAELIDIVIGEPGEPYIEILEPDWKFNRIGRLDK